MATLKLISLNADEVRVTTKLGVRVPITGVNKTIQDAWQGTTQIYKVDSEDASLGGAPHVTYKAKTSFARTDTRNDISVAGYAVIGSSAPVVFGEDLTVGPGLSITTSVLEKIGEHGAVPQVQGAAIANATDAGSAITQLNLLLAYFRARGSIAT